MNSQVPVASCFLASTSMIEAPSCLACELEEEKRAVSWDYGSQVLLIQASCG